MEKKEVKNEEKEFIVADKFSAMDEEQIEKIIGIESFDQAEWCYQFDSDDPVVIAWSNDVSEPGELTFMLKANSESNIIFQSVSGDKTLRIFSRSMSEERREQLGRPDKSNASEK
jgi:hypothetical protein